MILKQEKQTLVIALFLLDKVFNVVLLRLFLHVIVSETLTNCTADQDLFLMALFL